MNLTFQERTIWMNLIILLALFGTYLGYAISLKSPLRLGGAIVLLIVLQIVAAIILRLTSRHQRVDERDRKADANGSRVGYLVLIVFIWMSFGYFELHDTVSSAIVINLLIVGLVTAEISGLIAKLISYRIAL